MLEHSADPLEQSEQRKGNRSESALQCLALGNMRRISYMYASEPSCSSRREGGIFKFFTTTDSRQGARESQGTIPCLCWRRKDGFEFFIIIVTLSTF
jgi:hypothetical protein